MRQAVCSAPTITATDRERDEAPLDHRVWVMHNDNGLSGERTKHMDSWVRNKILGYLY